MYKRQEETPATQPAEPVASERFPSDETGVAPPSSPAPSSPRPQQPAAAELNLMSTVLPVMLRRYGLPVAGIVVLAVIIWFVAR